MKENWFYLIPSADGKGWWLRTETKWERLTQFVKGIVHWVNTLKRRANGNKYSTGT